MVEIAATVRQQTLSIEVADRGPGASDALLKAMFEPRRDPLLYFRGKYRRLHFA